MTRVRMYGIGGVGAFVRLYPLPKLGLHLEASLGIVRHSTTHTVTNYDAPLTCPWLFPTCFAGERRTITVVERSYGWELGGGAGYGFWVGDKWSFDLTGRFQLAHTWRGANEYWFYMPTLGLGMTLN